MKHEYTYKIQLVSIKDGTVQVMYTPKDARLVAEVANIAIYVRKYDDTQFSSVDEAIEFYAPHDKWTAQLTLLEQYDDLLNKTKTVSV